MINGSSFHHIGVACRDVARSERAYLTIGYSRVLDFTDPGLRVRGVFLEGAGPRLELVADLPGGRAVGPWLRSQAAMYHLAFEVPDVEAAVAAASDDGAKVVTRPTPAVAFAGRSIAFVMLRNGALVELIASI